MKAISLFLIAASAATGMKLGKAGASSNGVWVEFDARLEPESPSIRQHGSGVMADDSVIKRHIANYDNQTYFGYDLSVEPLAGGRYRLRFAPLSITPERMSRIFPKLKNWSPLPLPGGAATLEARLGETVALDLFHNSSTGQKVTDYLTIQGGRRERVVVEGPARDFSPEDAVIEFAKPRVTVDGKPLASTQGSISGNAVWVDLPGHGRFVFSLAPRTDIGMRRIGEIRGNLVTWRSDGRDFAIDCSKAVTTGSGAYHLYGAAVARAVTEFGMSAGAKPDVPLRGR